jgi:hypothetical protein
MAITKIINRRSGQEVTFAFRYGRREKRLKNLMQEGCGGRDLPDGQFCAWEVSDVKTGILSPETPPKPQNVIIFCGG